MTIKENHNFKVATFLPRMFDLDSYVTRLDTLQRRQDLADEITGWDKSYSWQIHSSGTRLDFWFEKAEDAMLFELRYQ